MYCNEVKIINAIGLHARPAAEFSKKANEFSAAITVIKLDDEQKKGNAKSVINVMAMGLEQGMMIQLCGEGEDEIAAVETLIALVQSGFGEV